MTLKILKCTEPSQSLVSSLHKKKRSFLFRKISKFIIILTNKVHCTCFIWHYFAAFSKPDYNFKVFKFHFCTMSNLVFDFVIFYFPFAYRDLSFVLTHVLSRAVVLAIHFILIQFDFICWGSQSDKEKIYKKQHVILDSSYSNLK